MGSSFSTTCFSRIIMSLLPPSYWSSIQTITTAERLGMTQGTATKLQMSLTDLISFFTKEAQHHAIDHKHSNAAESVLLAHKKRKKRMANSKVKSNPMSNPDHHCDNCNKTGHLKADCWSKGGSKEGQGPRQKKSQKSNKLPDTAAVAETKVNYDNLFAFTCTTDLSALANALHLPKTWLGACIDSGASSHYCPDRSKFLTYKHISGKNIVAADGHILKVVGIGDIHIELPNGTGKTQAMLEEAIHAPEMAFTLISIANWTKPNVLSFPRAESVPLRIHLERSWQQSLALMGFIDWLPLSHLNQLIMLTSHW